MKGTNENMSNESVAECLSHKDMRHVQVRLDYMQLYRNETKAKIIRILETWTNQKCADWYKSSLDSREQKQAPPEEDLWITMSYEQFSLFAYGTIKHDTIKQSIDELVSIKHIERRIHPTIPYGPPQYLLNIKEVQKSLDEQEMPSLVDDLELITPHRKKRTPQEKYPQGRGKNHRGDPGKIPPPGGENSYPSNNTTKNYRDNPKKEESIAPTSLSQKAALPSRSNPIPFAEQAKAITDRRQTDPALPVVKPPQTLPPQSQVSGPSDVAPPANVASTAQAGAPAKKKVTHANEPQQVPKCSTKEIQARINAYRGYALEEEVEIIRERKAIKTWCNLHELTDYDLVLHYLTTLDPYWRKPENKYRIGGLTLLKETPKALAEIAKRQNGKSPDRDETLGNYHYYRPQAAGGGR